MSSSPYINYRTLVNALDKIDEETFFEVTIGNPNKQGSVHYLNTRYNKNFDKPGAEPKYQVVWGYEIDIEDRVHFDGVNARLDANSGKWYLSASIPKTGNGEHTQLSELLIRALIAAIVRSVDLPTKNAMALKEIRNIIKHEDFPSITFKPHYAENYYDKKTTKIVAMEKPRATFDFDGSTWASSGKMPESLSGKVKSRIFTIATEKDIELMKEKGFNKKKIAAYEENLPDEDDDEETIERKLVARYKAGAIPRPWDGLKVKPINAIGGNSGTVFGQINFPGTLQLFKGEIRIKPSFGKCTFIPESGGCDGDSSSKYMDDDDEMLAFSRATTRVIKGSKGSGKLEGDSDEDEEASKKVQSKKTSKKTVVEDEDEEDEKVVVKKVQSKKPAKKTVVEEDDEDEEEEERVVSKKAKKPAKKTVVEEDEDDEEEAVSKKAKKPAKKIVNVVEDDDEDEEKVVSKKAKKPSKKVVNDEDEDEDEASSTSKKSAKKPSKKVVNDEDEDEDEASSTSKKSAKKPSKKPAKEVEHSDYEDDE
jgi:hypothetical protein